MTQLQLVFLLKHCSSIIKHFFFNLDGTRVKNFKNAALSCPSRKCSRHRDTERTLDSSPLQKTLVISQTTTFLTTLEPRHTTPATRQSSRHKTSTTHSATASPRVACPFPRGARCGASSQRSPLVSVQSRNTQQINVTGSAVRRGRRTKRQALVGYRHCFDDRGNPSRTTNEMKHWQADTTLARTKNAALSHKPTSENYIVTHISLQLS